MGGDEVSLGTARNCGHLLYCGRYRGTRAIPGSDGRCGPNNGPQCASCRRSFRVQNSEDSEESNEEYDESNEEEDLTDDSDEEEDLTDDSDEEEELENDEGVNVDVGSNLTLYCGRFLGRRAIPGSDGRCGPNNGPQCVSCRRSFPADSSDDDDCSDGSIYWDSDSEDGKRYFMRKKLRWMERRSDALQKAMQLRQRRRRRDLRAQQLERQEMQDNHREFMGKQIRKIEEMKSKLDHNEVSSNNFDKFCNGAAKKLSKLEIHKRSKKSIAVLGPSGVGKSTIINTFAGMTVTQTGLSECTEDFSLVYSNGEIDFYDVPGTHDHRKDFYTLQRLHTLKTLHMVLIVYESRVDHITKISRLMKTVDIPFTCVRNKCDFASCPPEEWRDCKDNDTELLNTVCKPIRVPLFFLGRVSGDETAMQGFEDLRRSVQAKIAVL